MITGYRPKHGFDLAAAAIGTVQLDRIIDGKHVEPDDMVIGLESNGVHSNGLTLAHRAFFERHKYDVDHQFEELEVPAPSRSKAEPRKSSRLGRIRLAPIADFSATPCMFSSERTSSPFHRQDDDGLAAPISARQA